MSPAPDHDFVFNLVLNGTSFTYLQYFVASQIHETGARFRFVVNQCPPEQVALMEHVAGQFPDQVVELFVASEKTMLGHGGALDVVLAQRDDGPYFSMIDPDILARGPFVQEFAALLDGGLDGVGSARGVWADTDVIPEGKDGVSGEYFYAPDGYLFGSPHFSIYKSDALRDTLERWPIGFNSGGPDCDDIVKKRLAEVGREYWVYDTGKIVNILFQADGHRLGHFEHPQLLHVGAMSHYLSPPAWGKFLVLKENGEPEPDWGQWPGQAMRFEVARFSANVLKSQHHGLPAPEIPAELDATVTGKLEMVRRELIDMVAKYEGVLRES